MDIMLERILSLLPKKADGSLVHGARTSFAKSIGAPSNIFAEWIAGRNNSYRNYLYQISAKYNVSVEWLRGETDEKEQKNKPTDDGELMDAESVRIRALISAAPEWKRKAVLAILEAEDNPQ